MTQTCAASAALIVLFAGVASGCTVHSYQSPPPGGTAAPAPTPAPAPTTPAPAPGAYNPCAGKTCGAACTVCDPNDKDCVETAVVKQCNAAGSCDAAPAQCGAATTPAAPAYNPCAGKQCGERCRICAIGDTTCIESSLIKLCHPDGQCKEATTVDCSKK
jgi:hypothetical protein